MSQSTTTNADQPTIVYGSGREPDAAIPRPGLDLRRGRVAIVVTDPQIDFLSPQGVSWSVVGQNVTENNTVEHIGRLFAASKKYDVPLFISPHKVYGPESNDLALQLRKRGIEQVVLAGMSTNLCVESHLRELLEQGFEVAVVDDATAAAQIPGYDGYAAAITNFRFLASDLWSFTENRIANRFPYEYCNADGQLFRAYGNELWEFDDEGLTRRREASINDVAIDESQPQFR